MYIQAIHRIIQFQQYKFNIYTGYIVYTENIIGMIYENIQQKQRTTCNYINNQKYSKLLRSMKNQILLALKNSLIGNNQTLRQSNLKLSEMSKIQGYCMTLMQIIDQPTFDISLKQAALIQLKNNIKSKWKPKNQKLQMSATQKNHIRNVLISAVVRCAKNYALIKIYREVLTTIIGYEFQTWIPFQDILNLLAKGQNIAPIFNCIIAICTNFQFSVIEKQKQIFTEFLKVILPAVLQTVKNNLQDAQIIYLSLKILWKSVHYQISNQIKLLTNDWMELIYMTISAYNEEMQNKLDQFQNKNTPEFYYFHSKKWATRILMRFVQRHAKAFQYGKINQQNLQFSNFWYQNYGHKLCDNILLHLSTPIPTTKKVRFFQLKTIQGIINDKPEMMSQHAKLFQYDILLKFMIVTVDDQNLAKEDVVQYLRVDDQSSMTYSNIKRVATQVWNTFLQLGSKMNKDQGLYYPGPLFQDSLKFMYEKITSQNLLEKQLGMYLFCQNKITVNKVPVIKQKMPQIIENYVVPELTNPAILIRARAFDMINEYGKDLKDISLSKAIESIYKGLTQDESHLIRIKAATALNPVITHSQCKQLLQPYLKQILKAYLFLIQKYDLEQVVSALQYFIGDFGQSIGPYALQMFKFLQQVFHRMFTKDIQLSQNQQYESQIQLAAAGCLKTMTQIIQSPLDAQIRMQLEPQVLNVCAFLFTNQSYEYHEDMMYLLRVHLQKVDKISPPCWFFYQVIIYFVAGIPNQLWSQIQNINLPEPNKKILQSVRQGNNLQFLQHAIPVLRNYFGKGYNMIIAQKQQFKINFVNMVFHLVGQVYRKGVTNSDLQGQIHLDCSSILLVYLVQTFPSQMTKSVIINIVNIIRFNLAKGKSIYIKQITCQLICVLLWKHPIQFLQILVKQKNLPLPNIIKHIKTIGLHLEQCQQKKRAILGISTYLLVAEKDIQILGQYAAQLFVLLTKLVKKNCYTRIILNTKQQNLKKQILNLSTTQSQQQNQNGDEDMDDQDLWDEEYNERHISILKKINQLAYFKETIHKINTESPQIYQIIVNSVPGQKLGMLQELLDKAVDLPEK